MKYFSQTDFQALILLMVLLYHHLLNHCFTVIIYCYNTINFANDFTNV